MVFVEFVSSNYPKPGAKHHFVGDSVASILADTKGGTNFGFANFSSWREITLRRARELKLGFLNEGIEAVVNNGTESFKLQTPSE